MLTYMNSRGCFINRGAPVLQWHFFPIIDAYICRSILTAQTSDVAQTLVGVTYLRFIRCVKNVQNNALCVHQRHICALQQKLSICISPFGYGHTFTFTQYDPAPHQKLKHRICDLLGVRKYASRQRIDHFPTFAKTLTLHT